MFKHQLSIYSQNDDDGPTDGIRTHAHTLCGFGRPKLQITAWCFYSLAWTPFSLPCK